jgi:glycerophosphoryl diester phosphodiesterase
LKKILIDYVILILVLALAAGYVSTTDLLKPEVHNSPFIIAHRAGGGHWPQNSRTAVLNSIAGAKQMSKPYHGIEIDIVLTKDGHPVLSHDPWVHTTLCRTASGEPIRERILIRDLTLAELQSQYLCGGVPDKNYSQATIKAEKIMTLDEVLDALKSVPQMVLYLDIKIDGDSTAKAEDYARALSRLLKSAQLPNRLYIEGPTAESLRAYRSAIHNKFVAVLSYPPFSAEESNLLTAMEARWLTKLRLRNPIDKARNANADAVAGPTQVITWTAARKARDNGVAVILFTPNTRKDLDRFCSWPIDVLLTDYPKLGRCP